MTSTATKVATRNAAGQRVSVRADKTPAASMPTHVSTRATHVLCLNVVVERIGAGRVFRRGQLMRGAGAWLAQAHSLGLRDRCASGHLGAAATGALLAKGRARVERRLFAGVEYREAQAQRADRAEH